jgi:Ca-activated chloride channel family protein
VQVMAKNCSPGPARKRKSGNHFGVLFSKQSKVPLLLLTSLLWLLSTISAAQSEAFAANPAPMPKAALPTFTKNVQEVNLVLTVTNWLGHFVKDLSEDDIRILDNNQPAERITYFQTQTNLPLRVGVVIDASASITHRFRFEQKSASAFLKKVLRRGYDSALLVSFNEQAQLVQDPTDDHKILSEAMTRFQPGGETAVYDAVAFSCKELAKLRDANPTRQALILITDGEDNHSRLTLEQAVEAALRSETIVYVLSTNPIYSTDLGEKGDTNMKQLAEATGGRLLRADTEDDVSRAFTKIDRELRNQYAIGYKPPVGRPDGLFHRLVVLGPKRLRMFHRAGYFASR